MSRHEQNEFERLQAKGNRRSRKENARFDRLLDEWEDMQEQAMIGRR